MTSSRKSKVIAYDTLKAVNPRVQTLVKFHQLFPDGMPVTQANVMRLILDGFSLTWLANILIDEHKRSKLQRFYCDAWGIYDQECTQAQAKCDKAAAESRGKVYTLCARLFVQLYNGSAPDKEF
jgi:hypothetical protein